MKKIIFKISIILLLFVSCTMINNSAAERISRSNNISNLNSTVIDENSITNKEIVNNYKFLAINNEGERAIILGSKKNCFLPNENITVDIFLTRMPIEKIRLMPPEIMEMETRIYIGINSYNSSTLPTSFGEMVNLVEIPISIDQLLLNGDDKTLAKFSVEIPREAFSEENNLLLISNVFVYTSSHPNYPEPMVTAKSLIVVYEIINGEVHLIA